MATSTAIQKIFAQVHSAEGLAFPNTVKALAALGVTRYHIDYTAGTATTYKTLPETEKVENEQISIPSPVMTPGTPWSTEGLIAAIRTVQRGEAVYKEFSQQCVDAGVTGYLAFLTGKNVLYYGAQGDFHVEWFPGAGPKVD